ncbi:MAG: SO_0444 family Cu/Zn efflux transporter [Bacteriovoracaceae bacterium]|nr:SO_0444 family Cu/Zn efflux transporter [Bacteriovoracaceae bacterium]
MDTHQNHPIFSFWQLLWNYLEISSPYLILGLFISGAIHYFMPKHLIAKWMGGHKLANIFKASLLGVPLPLCSCSVIPTSIAFLKMGASKSATSAFMISTPESGIDSILMTYGVMDFPMTIVRPIAAFISASLAGGMNFFFETKDIKQQTFSPTQVGANEKVAQEPKKKWTSIFHYGFVELLDDMIGWLIFGLVCGALISWLVPEDFFLKLDPTISRMGITVLATLLYICASASTPVAASLILKGMSPGTAIIFLLLGPATNISNLIIMQKYLGRRAIVINLIAIIFVAYGFSYFIDYGYAHWWNLKDMKLFHKLGGEVADHEHQDVFGLMGVASSWIFGLLMLASFWRVYLRNYLFGANNHGHSHTHAHAHENHHHVTNGAEKKSCCNHTKS